MAAKCRCVPARAPEADDRAEGAALGVLASAADLAHRPGGTLEVDLADAMAGPLRADGLLDDRGKPVLEIIGVESARSSQFGAQVEFLEGEQARPKRAFGGHADPVTLVAKRFGDTRDHADVPDAVDVAPPFSWLDMTTRMRRVGLLERERRVDLFED